MVKLITVWTSKLYWLHSLSAAFSHWLWLSYYARPNHLASLTIKMSQHRVALRERYYLPSLLHNASSQTGFVSCCPPNQYFPVLSSLSRRVQWPSVSYSAQCDFRERKVQLRNSVLRHLKQSCPREIRRFKVYEYIYSSNDRKEREREWKKIYKHYNHSSICLNWLNWKVVLILLIQPFISAR